MAYKYSEDFKAILEEVKLNENIAEGSYNQTFQPRTNHFIEFLGGNEALKNRAIRDISASDIQTYFSEISKPGKLSWSTIKSAYNVLKKIFNYLYQKKGFIDVFKEFDINNYKTEENSMTEPFIINKVDVSKLYNFIACQDNEIEERLLLALILQNGLTKGEIKNLRRCDIDFDERHLYVTTKDNRDNEDKTILADNVMLLIRIYITENKRTYHDKLFNCSASGLETRLNKITKKAINKQLSYSKVRDIFRYHIIKKYKSNVYLISKLLNENVGQTERVIRDYEIFTNEDIEEDIRHLLNQFNEDMK